MSDPTFGDLDESTQGRINGLLEASGLLLIQRENHHADGGEPKTEVVRGTPHHQSCYNTCTNMSKEIQKKAIEVAMQGASDDE